MPELPEVETIVRGLRGCIEGKVVSKTWGIDFGRHLVRKTIKGVGRRGKYITISLQDGSTLLVHLGMTGRLLHCQSSQGVSKHTRAVLVLENGSQLRFDDVRKFGKLRLYRRGEPIPEIERLGVEPLEPGLSPRTLRKIVNKTTRRVKDLLMDQSVIAGIGNIYAHEILFASGVNPFAASCSLSDQMISSLSRNVKRILRKAIAREGTTLSDYRTVEGREGKFQKSLQVYRKDTCPRCKGAIARVKLSGRSTYYCPRCQKG